MKIMVNGKLYEVSRDIGYQDGYYVKAVVTDRGERIAFQNEGKWRWQTPEATTKESANGL